MTHVRLRPMVAVPEIGDIVSDGTRYYMVLRVTLDTAITDKKKWIVDLWNLTKNKSDWIWPEEKDNGYISMGNAWYQVIYDD